MSHAATNWAIQQRGLKPTTKIVLWHLCDRFNPDYGCFPTQSRLAHDCEISRATLNRHLDDLEHVGLVRRIRTIDKRALGVQAALEWAFRVECAQLELPPRKNVTEESFSFGLEYVLQQRGALGCKIDGGRHKMGSYTHPDAEVIAATVAGMPDRLGGIRMAIRVSELARAGSTPDWMPGVVPRCVPVDIRQNQHGERATTIVVGTERVLSRGKWRTIEVLACPVTWRPHPEQIASARRGYEDWWQALDWVRDGLKAGRMLREVEVMAAMPKVRPWERK